MMNQSTRKVVRKIVQNTPRTETPTLLPAFRNVLDKKKNLLHRVQWLFIILLILSLCIYQSFDRIVYYSQGPIRVRTQIAQENMGYFPEIHFSMPFTVRSTTFEKKILEQHYNMTIGHNYGDLDCEVVSRYFFDNQTFLKKIWELRNATKEMKDIAYYRGKNYIRNVLTLRETYNFLTLSTTITNDQVLPLDSTTGIRVNLDYNIKETYLDMFAVTLKPKGEGNRFAVTTNLHFGNFFRRNKFAFSSRKYKFENREKQPCVTSQVMDKCHDNCYLSKITKNITCQLPFMPPTTANDCVANREACKMLFHLRDVRRSCTPHYECQCARECDRNIIVVHYFSEDLQGGEKKCIIYPFDNWIITFSEYFCYDSISLLCDIGGYFGLYTGLSLLTLITAITVNGQNYYKKLVNSKNRNKLQRLTLDCIRKRVKKRGTKVKKSVKLIILVPCIFLYVLQIYHRISLYITYPVYVTVEVAEERLVKIPSVAICYETDEIFRVKQQIRDNCNEDVDITLLLNQSFDVIQLWNQTANLNDFNVHTRNDTMFDAVYKIRTGKLSYISTMYGKCIKMESDEIEYNPATVPVFLNQIKPEEITDECNPHSKIFLLNEDNKLDYSNHFIHPHNSLFTAKFTLQTVLRLNTRTNPCTSGEEFKKCQETCYRNKLSKYVTNCRLPFLDMSHLPLCNSSSTAMSAKMSFLSAIFEKCVCTLPCTETRQMIQTVHEHVDFLVFTVSRYTVESDNREIFLQQLLLPLTKLVSDIGSLMGLTLGWSLLSMIHHLPKLIQLVKKTTFR